MSEKHILFNGTYLFNASMDSSPNLLKTKYEKLKVDSESQSKPKLILNKYCILFKAFKNSIGVPNATTASYLIKILTFNF